MDARRIGTIREVHGPVVTVFCDVLPPLRQALEVHSDGDRYILEVYQHVDEKHLRAIALHRATGLKRGLPVDDLGAPIRVPVSPKCLGRLLNIFGEPLDDGPALSTEEFRNILGRPIPLYESSSKREVLETGIKVDRSDVPVHPRWKSRPFWGRRRGKDCTDHGIHAFHRQASSRRIRFRGSRRTHSRSTRTLARDAIHRSDASDASCFRTDGRITRRAVPRRTIRAHVCGIPERCAASRSPARNGQRVPICAGGE